MTSYQYVRADSTNFAGQLFCISLIFTAVLKELLFRYNADCFSLSLIWEFVIQKDYHFETIYLLASYYVAVLLFILPTILCFL